MRPFRSRLGRFTAAFDPAEATLLADLVDQVRTLLAQRGGGAEDDPLAGLTGMAVGPSTPPGDPAVARLLPAFHRDDEGLAAGLRMLREPEVIAAKDDAAVTLLDTLPRGGGTVRLTEQTARSWLVALNDVRLVFGVRLNITDDAPPPAAAAADPRGPEYAMYLTYRWLSTIQESLVQAMLGDA